LNIFPVIPENCAFPHNFQPPPTAPYPPIDFLLDLRKRKKITEAVFQKVARENAVRVLDLSR